MKLKALTAILGITLLLSPLFLHKVFGQTNTSINASVQIGICGNGVVDRGEDCDGTNLNGKTCVSLGYASGTLSCDISCSFDTSQCISPTPTPTLIPTPTPTPTSEPASQSTNSSPITPTSAPFPTTFFPTVLSKSILPLALQAFDISGTGHITKAELPVILKSWVADWKKAIMSSAKSKKHLACDIDNDENGTCDLKDLSILLYYVDK